MISFLRIVVFDSTSEVVKKLREPSTVQTSAIDVHFLRRRHVVAEKQRIHPKPIRSIQISLAGHVHFLRARSKRRAGKNRRRRRPCRHQNSRKLREASKRTSTDLSSNGLSWK